MYLEMSKRGALLLAMSLGLGCLVGGQSLLWSADGPAVAPKPSQTTKSEVTVTGKVKELLRNDQDEAGVVASSGLFHTRSGAQNRGHLKLFKIPNLSHPSPAFRRDHHDLSAVVEQERFLRRDEIEQLAQGGQTVIASFDETLICPSPRAAMTFGESVSVRHDS